jgi:deoxyribonuclease-4
MNIRFGPAGLGPVAAAEDNLKELAKKGLKACEIAFTYGVYIKNEEDAIRIGKKASELDIELSVHAPYWVNLNSAEKAKREATRERILESCRIGELLGAKVVVFHPGYYGKNREASFDVIKEGVVEIMKEIKERGWKIKIAPETMGKVNVFGSVEEISRLAKEAGCAFCIDFAHILARDKKVDYEKIRKLFPQKEWHCHFSGIVYGDKGEKNHRTTLREEWVGLLRELKKLDKFVRIINESPTMIEDCVEGLKTLRNI